MKPRRPQPETPTAAQMLDAVPVPNQAVGQERSDGGELILFVPVRQRWFNRPPLTLVMPYRQRRGVALDKLGEEVWRACDGRRTAEQIIEDFARKHHLRFHEARVSVMTFLRELTQRGAVVMVGGAPGGQPAEAAEA